MQKLTRIALTSAQWKRLAFFATALIGVAAYWDQKALRGPFIYDDVASIVNNEVVLARVPWQEAFTRDFWGTPMKTPQSHKSYRPITSLTLRLNMVWSYITKTAGGEDHTYYFHVVNVFLHGINSGLATETAAIVLGGESLVGPIIAGISFGLHPVHAESVSNITSRGELLMTFFFLLAFLSYANHIPEPFESSTCTARKAETEASPSKTSPTEAVYSPKGDKKGPNPKVSSKPSKQKSSDPATKAKEATELNDSKKTPASIIYLFVLPCVFMAFSLFSKEQGVTTLCTLVAFDFIRHHTSLKSFLGKILQGDTYTWDFLKRTSILAAQTVALAGLRYALNGESKPEFVEEQNPAGFAKDPFQRIFTVNWVYCLYLYDMVYPAYLAPDWSGKGIPLIESLEDERAWKVSLVWLFVSGCTYSLCFGPSSTASKLRKDTRQVVLIAFFAFLFLPFLLSSNLLVTTGLTKADRVIYLPLFGYCLFQGFLYKAASSDLQRPGKGVALMILYTFLTIQFSFFILKTHERNLAWADEYTLWTKAAKINPLSHHTRSNAGRLLAKNGEYVESEEMLRMIGDVKHGGNPNDAFLLAVSLSKLDRCEEAFRLIDDATKFIFDEREEGGIRYDAKMSFHSQSSLVVARSFCTHDVIEKGKLMQEALIVDPSNEFARAQYTNYMETLQNMYLEMKQKGAHNHPEFKFQMVAAEQQLLAMEQQMQQIKQQHGMALSPEEAQQRMRMQQMKQKQINQQQMQQQQQEEEDTNMRFQSQEQLQTMQLLVQQRGLPQNEAELRMMEQEMSNRGVPLNHEQIQLLLRMQQQQQQPQLLQRKEQVSPKEKVGQSNNEPSISTKQGATRTDIRKNVAQPPSQDDGLLGMPPIEDFESGKYDDVFFNEREELPAQKSSKNNHAPSKARGSDDPMHLGMPPIEDFESDEFNGMFYN